MKLFWVHHQQKELAKSITQPFYQTCLFSHQCLFLTLAVLDRAYFRDMLILEPMLIFARVRYSTFYLIARYDRRSYNELYYYCCFHYVIILVLLGIFLKGNKKTYKASIVQNGKDIVPNGTEIVSKAVKNVRVKIKTILQCSGYPLTVNGLKSGLSQDLVALPGL